MKNISLILLFSAIVLFSLSSPVLAGDGSARFVKLDEQGKELPVTAEKWAIVLDKISGLYWEVKSEEEGVHFKEGLYKFGKAKKEVVKKLNAMSFGGFTDWRLPTTTELNKLKSEGQEPAIDTDFFPNTQPAAYHSWNICGSGEFVTEKVKFGSRKTKGKKRYARAVRGGNPPSPEE